MSRAQRLLALLQLLRQHRFPVRGEQLAEQLGVSLRTLYRDIRTLQAQGANIEGEAGVGYLLRPGFMLPPLMFSPEELEAIALGARWVNERGDSHLAAAAQSALGKIGAVLPQPLHYVMEHSGLRVGLSEAHKSDDDVMYQLRLAIRQEQRIDIVYRDLKNQPSTRTLWPLALGYFDQTQLLAAWCELRQDFRHFRTDRIVTLTRLPGRFPKRREHVLQAWRKSVFDMETPPDQKPTDRN
ncbi:helix-turn-helix transcriptional regulator [Candidatus Symbiopectobacterium sp. NZEC135]|uniref:helix-turn-helix transcriptional regulator n=1 Tax=Candidatus Symbiopectobacterium sp. NZEC135 TaxID=2820471 RepID=UPI002226FF3E|nr:YafY family protein [Candidatus Symbiopectobacterium sp. NZEC135]MCW2479638.1 YafY family transcriptional regulator [Candidatus Symbiopectobacterium sp. NZEC135]